MIEIDLDSGFVTFSEQASTTCTAYRRNGFWEAISGEVGATGRTAWQAIRNVMREVKRLQDEQDIVALLTPDSDAAEARAYRKLWERAEGVTPRNVANSGFDLLSAFRGMGGANEEEK